MAPRLTMQQSPQPYLSSNQSQMVYRSEFAQPSSQTEYESEPAQYAHEPNRANIAAPFQQIDHPRLSQTSINSWSPHQTSSPPSSQPQAISSYSNSASNKSTHLQDSKLHVIHQNVGMI
jgi:hypothetical protein